MNKETIIIIFMVTLLFWILFEAKKQIEKLQIGKNKK
jgi:hypothetical protein|tara:strand:- start:680 stop:790 length:111 start_codon:yes stop_codon:yes gene_type:complete